MTFVRTVFASCVVMSILKYALAPSGAPAERCHVVPNAVDVERFHPGVAPADDLGIPDDADPVEGWVADPANLNDQDDELASRRLG